MNDFTGAAPAAAEGAAASSEAPSAGSNDSLSAVFDRILGPEDGSGALVGDDAGSGDAGRDEHGRFAPKAGQQVDLGAAADVEVQPDAGTTAAVTAPHSWSPAAKEALRQADPAIQAAVAKREAEVNDGFAKLSAYKELDAYNEHFRQQGGSLKTALDSYMNAERALAKDFIGGLKGLARMYGHDPVAVAQAMLGQRQQQANEPGADQPQGIDPRLLERMEAIESNFKQTAEQRAREHHGRALSEIETVAKDLEFWPNVLDDVIQIVNGDPQRYRGVPINKAIADAYEAAIWANPETRAVLIKRQAVSEGKAKAEQATAAVNQTKQRAKSLNGSPGMTGDPKLQPPKNSREAVERAAASLGI